MAAGDAPADARLSAPRPAGSRRGPPAGVASRECRPRSATSPRTRCATGAPTRRGTAAPRHRGRRPPRCRWRPARCSPCWSSQPAGDHPYHGDAGRRAAGRVPRVVLGRVGPLRRGLVHDDRRQRLQLHARHPVAGGVLPRYPLVVRAVSRVIDNTPLAGIAAAAWRCGRPGPVPPLVPGPARPGRRPRRCCAWPLPVRLLPVRRHVRRRPVPPVRGGGVPRLERDHLVLAGLAARSPPARGWWGWPWSSAWWSACASVAASSPGPRAGAGPAPDRLRLRDGWVLLSLGGLAAWSGWLWARYGDPLLFSTVQESWGQQAGLATWSSGTSSCPSSSAPGASTRWAWSSRPRSAWRWPPPSCRSPAASAGATVPTSAPWCWWVVGSQDFQGLGRYLLGAFPVRAGGCPAGRAAGRPPCRAPAVGRRAGGLHRDVRQRPLHLLRLHGPRSPPATTA